MNDGGIANTAEKESVLDLSTFSSVVTVVCHSHCVCVPSVGRFHVSYRLFVFKVATLLVYIQN